MARGFAFDHGIGEAGRAQRAAELAQLLEFRHQGVHRRLLEKRDTPLAKRARQSVLTIDLKWKIADG
jgi:hypothetical protein